MSSYILFSCSIPDNAPQEKDVETQRLSQVLLSVAGIIDRHPSCLTRGLPCIPDPGQSVPIRYPHSFLSWNLCPIKYFAHWLIQALPLSRIELPLSSPTNLLIYSVNCKQYS